MAGRERWRIVKQLTIYQVALLIEGYNPASFDGLRFFQWHVQDRSKVLPIVNALRQSVDDGSLPVHKVVYEDENLREIDFHFSLFHVDQILKWLEGLGVYDGFFRVVDFSIKKVEDRSGAFYAPKLAAANDAWKAVTSDPKRLRGKTPKQALEIWLEEHAAEYGLLGRDGKPNATGIEEIAKVANWKPAGGAPITPRDIAEPGGWFGDTPPLASQNTPSGLFGADPDDEIPF